MMFLSVPEAEQRFDRNGAKKKVIGTTADRLAVQEPALYHYTIQTGAAETGRHSGHHASPDGRRVWWQQDSLS